MSYNITNWYWFVGGNGDRLWSSASASYVSPSDATYQAWHVVNGAPTNIDTEDNLRQLLDDQYPAGWPGGDLPDVLARGIVIASAGTPLFDDTYNVDDKTQDQLFKIAFFADKFGVFPNGDSTYPNWPALSGNLHTLTVALALNLLKASALYVDALEVAAATARATATTPVYPDNHYNIQ